MASRDHLQSRLRAAEKIIDEWQKHSSHHRNISAELITRITQFLLLGCMGFLAASLAWIGQSSGVHSANIYFALFLFASGIFLFCSVASFCLLIGTVQHHGIEQMRAKHLIDHYELVSVTLRSLLDAGIEDDKEIRRFEKENGIDDFADFNEPAISGNALKLIRHFSRQWVRTILIVGTMFLIGAVLLGFAIFLYYSQQY